MRAMLQRIEPVHVTPDDGYIAWPPMFHIGGTDSTLAAMMRGAKVMIMDGFDAEQLVAIAAREKIAHLSVLPGVIDGVIDAFKTTGLRPLSVRTVGLLADLVVASQYRGTDKSCWRTLLQQLRFHGNRLAAGQQSAHPGWRDPDPAFQGAELVRNDAAGR